jgi:hypothetical protein
MHVLLPFVVLLTACAAFAVPLEERPFDAVATKIISGCTWSYTVKDLTIAKQLFTSSGRPDNSYTIGRTCTFAIRGWDHFTAYVGIVDQPYAPKAKVTISVDEQMVFQQDFEPGGKAQPLDVVLTGNTTLTIKVDGDALVFADPKLVKGEPTPFPKELPVTVLRYTAAPFAAEYADLDKLALSLRAAVNGNAAVKERLEKGTLALAPLFLIDLPVAAVGHNTCEDFSTALVNAGFPLVERGGVLQAMQQVKMPESGLLDPATIQQLGKATGCDVLLVGSLSDRGAVLVLNLRLVDTATGKALMATRADVKKTAPRK